MFIGCNKPVINQYSTWENTIRNLIELDGSLKRVK